MSRSISGTIRALMPLQDRIAVKRNDPERESAGGILLPDAATETPQSGVVVSVGPGKILESGQVVPVSVAVGDTVLFGKYSGTEIQIGGEAVLIIREEDIMGKLC